MALINNKIEETTLRWYKYDLALPINPIGSRFESIIRLKDIRKHVLKKILFKYVKKCFSQFWILLLIYSLA